MWFEAILGLEFNLKSELILVGSTNDIDDLAKVFGSIVGDVGKERFQKYLALWKRQYLSKGAKLTLIKSTISSLPIYVMLLFAILRKVSLSLEKIQRDFL